MPTSKKIQSLTQLALMIVTLIVVNFAANYIKWDIDLTGDKRFTMSQATYDLLDELDQDVIIEVFLDGQLPASFAHLQNSIRELLDKFRARNSHVQYKFTDPLGEQTDSILTDAGYKEYLQSLNNKGIKPVTINIMNKGAREQRLVFPAATIRIGSVEKVVNLLEEKAQVNQDLSQSNSIAASINLLEYKFTYTVAIMLKNKRPNIGILTGHGELDRPFTNSLEKALFQNYEVMRINLDETHSISPFINVLIIAKPTQPLGEKHQFIIDQYIMNGGKVIWAVDMLVADLNAFSTSGEFVPMERGLDIGSQLFNYGVRVNANLIADLECSTIPVEVGQVNGQPQYQLLPWLYHVRSYPYSLPTEREQGTIIDHPITKNLDYVDTRFPSSIDTVKTRTEIKKTPLLRSSRYSKVQFPPVSLSINMTKANIGQDAFPPNKGYQNIAVLLEGPFESYFRNRVSPEMHAKFEEAGRPIVFEGKETQMIVISDGDIFRNDILSDNAGNKVKDLEVGLNKYEGYQYGNKDFIINCIEYLSGNSGLLATRNKDIKMRPLDQERARVESFQWQAINLIVPFVVLSIFGAIYVYLRKKRNTF